MATQGDKLGNKIDIYQPWKKSQKTAVSRRQAPSKLENASKKHIERNKTKGRAKSCTAVQTYVEAEVNRRHHELTLHVARCTPPINHHRQ